MAFEIIRDGVTQPIKVDVSFDPASFSLRELLRIEDVLGAEDSKAFLEGGLAFTPRTFHAVLYAKLASQVPGLKPDEFDLPADAIAEVNWDDEGA